MTGALLPPDEAERLAALRAYEILDTPPEQAFDDLVAVASTVCETPIALISLVDEERQWFKARVGLDVRETSREVSFCAHAILETGTMVIEDAMADDRFHDNPLVTGEPRIRFYAGAPIRTPEGHPIGTLCVIDHQERSLTPEQQQVLEALARRVTSELELRRAGRLLKNSYDALLAAERGRATILHSSLDCVVVIDEQGRIVEFNRAAEATVGLPRADAIGMNMGDLMVPERLREAHAKGMRRLLAGGKARVLNQRLELPAIRANGDEFPAELSIVELEDTGGKGRRFVGFLRDLTGQREAEHERERLRQFYQQVLEAMPAQLAVFDRDLRYLYVTPSAIADPEVREWIVGHNDAEYWAHRGRDPALAEERMRRLAQVRDSKEPAAFEEAFPDAAGEVRHFARLVSPVLDDAGEVIQVLGYGLDVTERRRAEEALERSRQNEVQLGARIQQSLLTGSPPPMGVGVSVATLTIPSQQLDGDFLDFLAFGRRTLDVVIGDVMGKGIAAALLGAATRTAFVRAVASLAGWAGREAATPAAIVSEVGRALTGDLIATESFVSACYARLDLASRRLTFVDCGHPRILLYSPKRATLTELAGADMPLGFLEHHEYTQISVPVEPHDTVVLFTDGIVEARSPSGELFGIERLQSAISDHVHLRPTDLARQLRAQLEQFLGGAPFGDDITLAVLRLEETSGIEASLPRSLESLDRLRAMVDECCAIGGLEDDRLAPVQVRIAAQEVFTNIIKHSDAGSRDDTVTVTLSSSAAGVSIEFLYAGSPYQPSRVALPDLSTMPEGGFGLYLIEASVDHAVYETQLDGLQRILLVKHVPRDAA
jgi:PAS domain S-box-containing protein